MALYQNWWEAFSYGEIKVDDNFTGDGDDDEIRGRGGNNTLKGGAGDDTITSWSGTDYLDGGDDNDDLSSGGGNDTLYGGSGNDTLDGGSGNDFLDGGDNTDTLYGGDGSDFMHGGYGSDNLYGGSGNDSLYGGRDSYSDTLYGEDGNDYLEGYGGDDYLDGGSGDDVFNGGDGNDTLIGGSGNDTLYATWYNSDGTSNYNKYLDGGSGNDSIRGGGGDDTLIGGIGNDTLDGRGGYDTVLVTSEGQITDFGFHKIIDGVDTITITDSAITQTGEKYQEINGNKFTIGWNNSTDSISNIEAVEIEGYSGNETLDASAFSGDVTFTSGEGNDTLIGSQGFSVAYFDGNIGDFEVTQNGSTWTVKDNNASDGNQGTNTLTNIDEIYFSSDNVTGVFDTASYSSVVSAVAGTDNGITYISAPNYGATQYIIGLEGSTDPLLSFDTEKLGDFVNAITLNDTGGDSASLWTNIGLEVLASGLKQIPKVGTVFSTGVKIAQQLSEYGNSSDADAQIAATEAVLNDANYSADSWINFSQPNRDVIRITDFQIGVDTIILPSIADATNVSYQMEETDGGVTVSIKIDTNEAEDFLFIENNYSGAYGIDDDAFAATILDLIQSDGYNGSTISTFRQTTTNVEANDFVGVSQSGSYAGDIIHGEDYIGNSSDAGAGSFSLIGQYGDDLLQGANKDDYLYGGFNSTNPGTPFVYEHDGHDILQGNEGNDTLDGGSGSDILDGGEGTDVLIGGEGADIFAFKTFSNTDVDVITDFELNQDTVLIDLSAFGANFLSELSYNETTGALSFNNQQFATVYSDYDSSTNSGTTVSGLSSVLAYHLEFNASEYNIQTPLSSAWNVTGSGDFNGDGTDDILLQNDNGQVHAWQMQNSQRVSGYNISNPVGSSWELVGSGDFNGDGTDDILLQNDNGQVHAWQMQNSQRVSGYDIANPVGSNWDLIGSGDFNGDGTDDILWQNNSGQVHVWEMQNSQRVSGYDISDPVSSDWNLMGTGDFDSDGIDDILWQDNSGQIFAWDGAAASQGLI